jgi:hypothetical protein
MATVCKCALNILAAADMTVLALQEKGGLLYCCTSVCSLVHVQAVGRM